MKKSGWVIATVTSVTDREIEFRIDESEEYQGVVKFPELVGKIIQIPTKPKFWKSELVKGRKQFITFNRTEDTVTFAENLSYVLLIQLKHLAPIRLVGTGSKKDLLTLLGRASKKVADPVYRVNIPIIQGFVKGTLGEIIIKLRNNCPGDPEVYLTHRDTTWSIYAPDGELKETTMPILPLPN